MTLDETRGDPGGDRPRRDRHRDRPAVGSSSGHDRPGDPAGGGRQRYRAYLAQDRADIAAERPKPGWTQTRPWLWDEVSDLLRTKKWSPEQIARRLRRDHPDEPQWWVSHEAIYQAIFVQAKGELRKELAACLRTGGPDADPRGRVDDGRVEDRRDGQHLRTTRRGRRPGRAWPLGRRPDHRRQRRQRGGHPGRTHHPDRDADQARRPRPPTTSPSASPNTSPGCPPHWPARSPGTKAPSSPPTPRFTVATGVPVYFCDPTRPGSEAPTRTGTASSASSSPRAPTSPSTPKTTSTRSPRSSTAAPARPSDGILQPNDSTSLSRPPLEFAPRFAAQFEE